MDTIPNTINEVKPAQRSSRLFFKLCSIIVLLLVVLMSARSWHKSQMRKSCLLRLMGTDNVFLERERVPLFTIPSFLKISLPNWCYSEEIRKVKIYYNESLDGKLEGIHVLESIRYLELNRCRYTDAGIAPLAGLTNLEELSLYDSWITDTGLAHLSGLENLKILDLRHTQISDEGIVHLKSLKNLEELYLSDTYVTKAGLDHLAGLKKLKKPGLRSRWSR